ncbi:DNA mismatch endonuclease Vsr [Fluviicola sp.]|uniref:very short patch repair endonuclease n=1 Tax=Fluviicola sp. TaxID=1917219 RepID=UPI0031D50CFE
MSDVHSIETRSYNMSRIRSKNTKPEMLVRKFLFGKGLRYRLHDKTLPGKPDLVFPKYNVVLFIHGCFWHGHEGCKYFVVPKTRTEWWLEKIGKTVKHDDETILKLYQLGWSSLIVWECELKPEKRNKTLTDLYTKICQYL